MAKELKYQGRTLEELKQLGYSELAKLVGSRARRTLIRGLTDQQKKFIAQVKQTQPGKGKPIRTHLRDMIILPEMVGYLFHVYSGRRFEPIAINIEMVGRYLGEFVRTRQEVKHKAPGVGATRGTKHVSMK
jgi:small subunit ribosomal protein S19